MRVDPKALVRRLTPYSTRLLEGAAGKAVSAQHAEIDVEHFLLCMLEPDDGELALLLQQLRVSRPRLRSDVESALSRVRPSQGKRPVIATNLFQWLEDAWLTASVELGEVKLRSGVLFYQLVANPGRYTSETFGVLDDLDAAAVKDELSKTLSSSAEAIEAAPSWGEPSGGKPRAPGAGPAPDGALAKFTTDFTADAKSGRVDPIFGRSREIRQMVDILSRRRKNNPIIVGEPGVGKTALVEGLAHAVADGDVPAHLKDVRVLGLDLGALQAGASVKGEFENRLKAVISEVKSSPTPIILFIDEAHTLIGAGGPQGGSDAANLLKPALARGELRTIAATTWAEYKKYFEKDAALERRFQLVKVDEPSSDDAIVMLRGVRAIYEKAHAVAIRDEAVQAAVVLSQRYISGRQLPDKAVDLLDTTAARVRVERATKPEELVSAELDLAALERKKIAVARDLEDGDEECRAVLATTEEQISATKLKAEELRERWQAQRGALEVLVAARDALAQAQLAQSDPDYAGPKPTKSVAELREEARGAQAQLAALAGDQPLLHVDVDADAVGRTVASWTGIPVGKMQQDAAQSVLDLESTLQQRIIGQDAAVGTVAQILRISHAGIRDPNAPIGVMLFVGPSGVGKTETALALADELYGGERFMTTINMSEFQEKHSVSRLIGSPPGYVGYGEGGVLTEAVRQRPYSVVLLDECEKADLEVMNLFYQVFDKGMLTDGEGRLIDFRNTLIILTSNLASEVVMSCFEENPKASADEVTSAIRPKLSRHFQPALLARMSIVPYGPINADAMQSIARLKLRKITRRIEETHALRTSVSDALIAEIARRCTEAETGARNVDHILRGSLMPAVASELLQRMASNEEGDSLHIDLDEAGGFKITFA